MDEINELVATFPLSREERGSKPTKLTAESLKPDASLLWSATMVMIFVLHSCSALLPYIEKARENASGRHGGYRDAVWQCWLMHCHYIFFLLLNEYSMVLQLLGGLAHITPHLCHPQDLVKMMNTAICDHHQKYAVVHPDYTIAKFHYGLHFGYDTLMWGPQKHLQTAL